MKKIISLLFVAVLFLAMGNFANSQVDVTPSAATYANLKTAFNAINAGTHGNGAVTVTITANFAEPDSASLNGGVFTSCAINTNGAFTIAGNVNNAVVIFNGADNVTMDGRIGQAGSTRSLSITNTNVGTNNQIFKLQNGAMNDIVRYCNMTGVVNNGRMVNIGQSNAGTGGNNGSVFEFNAITNGARSLQVFGTANGASSFTNDNTTFRGNLCKNATAIGIFIGSLVNGVVCTQNEVFFDAPVMTTQASFTAIQVQGVGTISITKNKVYNFNLSGAPNAAYRGSISLPASVAPLVDPATTVTYSNNMISIVTNSTNTAAAFKGACIQTQFSAAATSIGYTANVYNNTMFFGGSSSVLAADLSESYAGNVVLPIGAQSYALNYKNNIAVNKRTGGSAAVFHIAQGYDSSSNLTVNADYNTAFASGSTGSWAVAYGAFVYPNGALEAWKSNTCQLNFGTHDMFKDVAFVSASDLHLAAGRVGGDLNGTPIASVTDDIDGAAKNATYPYKGCDEGAAFKILDMGAQLEGVLSTDQVIVYLQNAVCGTLSTSTADLNGTGKFAFGDSIAVSSYTIMVDSRNHIRTASAGPVSIGAGTTVYNFRSAQSQAFGSNMILDGGVWSFFGGEVTGDGVIDLADGAAVDNDASIFLSGCRVLTDVNNDGVVDLSDGVFPDNNAANFVAETLPCPAPTSSFNTNSNTEKVQINTLDKSVINSEVTGN
ncbi:MAG TPA: hypothetical protein PLX80_02060 [Ignavibacteria bacterium]|nr:hypothetical protein [Ignavibacteria bacterium]